MLQVLSAKLRQYEQMNYQQIEKHSNLQAEQGSLKDRYLSDYKTLHMRLQDQSHIIEQKTSSCFELQLLYENDMDEVRSLTGVLQDSIASLQMKLAQSEEQLNRLLRSELLEVLCVAVVGSRNATRSDVVTAFWNEKPETRVQLLNWFSELESNGAR